MLFSFFFFFLLFSFFFFLQMGVSAPLAPVHSVLSTESLGSSPRSLSSKRPRVRSRSRSKSISRPDESFGAVLLVGSIPDGQHEEIRERVLAACGARVKAVHFAGECDFGFVEFHSPEDVAEAEPALRGRLGTVTLTRVTEVTPGHDPRLGLPCDTLVLCGLPFGLDEAAVRARLAQADLEFVDVRLKCRDNGEFTGMAFVQFATVAAAEAAAGILRARSVFERRIKIQFKRPNKELLRKLEAFKNGPDGVLAFPQSMSLQDRQAARSLAQSLGLTPDPNADVCKIWKTGAHARAAVHLPANGVRGFTPSTPQPVRPAKVLLGRTRSYTLSSLRAPRGPDGTKGFAVPRTPAVA